MIPGIGLLGKAGGTAKEGQYIYANFDNGLYHFYKSKDSGNSFTPITSYPAALLNVCGVSGDSRYVVGNLANPGFGYAIYLSSNAGETWVSKITLTETEIPQISMNKTGAYISVYVIDTSSLTSKIYRSTNYGQSFSEVTSPGYFSLNVYMGCMSDDGSRQYFITSSGLLKSSDFGDTWSYVNSVANGFLQCSGDGSKLVSGYRNNIRYSTNYGEVFTVYSPTTDTNQSFRVGISPDGMTSIAVSFPSEAGVSLVFTSEDGLQTFQQKSSLENCFPMSLEITRTGSICWMGDSSVGLRKSIDKGASWSSAIFVGGGNSFALINKK